MYATPNRPRRPKGFAANSLSLGCDCLGAVRYFDGVVNDAKGAVRRVASLGLGRVERGCRACLGAVRYFDGVVNDAKGAVRCATSSLFLT